MVCLRKFQQSHKAKTCYEKIRRCMVISSLFGKFHDRTTSLRLCMGQREVFAVHGFSVRSWKTNSGLFSVDDQEFKYSTVYITDFLYICTRAASCPIFSFTRQMIRYLALSSFPSVYINVHGSYTAELLFSSEVLFRLIISLLIS